MRRSAGEGSIHRYKGQWRVRVRRHGRERSWIRPTHAAAAACLREALRDDSERLVRLRGRRLSVEQWAAQWLDAVELAVPRSYPAYKKRVTVAVLPAIGALHLDDVEAEDVMAVVKGCLQRNNSRTTAQLVYDVMHVMFDAAVSAGRMTRNPTELVARPQRGHFEGQPLTPAEVGRLVKEARNDREIGMLVILALTTGMRQGELFALTWADVRPEECEILVVKSAQRVPGKGVVVAETKTKSSRRRIPMDPRTYALMQVHHHRLAERQLATPDWQDHDLVFPTSTGGHRAPSGAFSVKWAALLSRATVPHVRFHDLRHTAGLLLTRRVGLIVASRILGHASPAITAMHYGHAQPQDMEFGIETLTDQVLADPPQNPSAAATVPVDR